MTITRSRAFLGLLFCGSMLGGVARAQAPLTSAPSPRIPVDAHGVNVVTGKYSRADTLLSLGTPGAGGISIVHEMIDGAGSDNYVGTISSDGHGGYYVNIGSSTDTFSGNLTNTSGTNSTLTYNTSNHTGVYTTGDGTSYTFAASPGPSFSAAYYSYALSVLSSVKHPDGQVDSYNYETPTICDGPPPRKVTTSGDNTAAEDSSKTSTARPAAMNCTRIFRIHSIASNTGYEFDFFYTDYGEIYNAPHFNIDYISDSAGDSVSYSYGSNGYISGFNNNARVIKYGYDANTNISNISIGNSSPVTISFTFDPSTRRVASFSDGVATYNYSYSDDGSGNRTTTVGGPSGNKTYFSNIANAQVLRYQDEKNQATTFSYDANFRLTNVQRPEGDQTIYVYTADGRNNVQSITSRAKSGSGLADLVTQYGYGCQNALSCNKPTSVVDAKGFQTDYAYDSRNGQVSVVSLPAPSSGAVRPQTVYTYTPQTNGILRLTRTSSCVSQAPGSCAGSSDEEVTAIGYPQDASASHYLPTSVTTSFGNGSSASTTAFSYTAAGDVQNVDGPSQGSGRLTHYVYGYARQLTGVVGPDPDGSGPLRNRAIKYTYNDSGETVRTEQGTTTGQADSDFYNNFSSLVTVNSAFNVQGLKTLDQLVVGGQVRRSYQYGYNTRGLPQCTAVRLSTDPSTYPSSACSTTSNSAAERITQIGYDTVGNRTLTIEAVGTSQATYTYQATFGANNEQLTAKDANGNLTSFGYDGFNRLTSVTFPAADNQPQTESYTYDSNSNRTQLVRRGGATLTYGYDNLNRLISLTQPGTTASYANYTYGYDNVGQLRAASSNQTVNGQGVNYAYAYDAQGHVTIEALNGANLISAYDAAGNRTQLTWPDGFFVSYGYDFTNAMTSVRDGNVAPGGNILLAQFGYDDQGRRTSVTRGNGSSTTYGYNGAQLLTTMTHFTPASGSETENFYYNIENQVIQSTKSNEQWAWNNAYNFDRSYTANALNEQITAGNSSTFTWGAKGVLTRDSGMNLNYSYDVNNRLFFVSNGSSQQYDASGRIYSAGASGSSHFAYDGDLAVMEYSASNNLTQRYVPGPNEDEPIAWYNNGSRTTLLADRQGSVVGVVNDSGQLVIINSYDEYGLPGSNNAGRYQYTGQKYLPEIGMYDFKARNYSTTLGRFVEPDPTLFGDGLNVYQYGRSDPLNVVDPTGTNVLTDFFHYITSSVGSFFSSTFGFGGSPAVNTGQNVGRGNSPVGGIPSGTADEVVVTGKRPPGPISSTNITVTRSDFDADYYRQKFIFDDQLRSQEGASRIVAGIVAVDFFGPLALSGLPEGATVSITAPEMAQTSLFDPSIRGPRSVPNIATDVGPKTFQNNLENNGFKVISQGQGRNGEYTALSNGTSTFNIYTRSSTGSAGAEYIGPAGSKVKFTLGGG